MILLTAAVGIIQLIIAVILAVVALYIGFYVFGRVTRDVDEQQELAKGNVAFGIVVAAIFIAIAVVVQSGITGLSVGVSKASAYGLMSVDGLTVIGIAIVQLILGVVLAVVAIYIALSILDHLTINLHEFEELKKGNVAVAIEMAGVIIAVALIIQSGVVGITAALG
ncbi:MAG: DUF350 domain-containing protein [Methanoregula sp.]|uniref:DUF350 domain-containing protein n=1 Tax=Methanoregula sp. TaxID=2052170 RepID=UPI003BAFF561